MSTSIRGRPIKTKIKPPRKQGDVSVDDIWAQLARNIREIHAHNAFKLSFEENHRFGYNIVLAGRGDMLYKGVKQLITENLDRLANEQVIPAFPTGDKNDITEQSDERTQLLKALRNVWEDHQSNMSKLRDILKYLDRVYAKKESLPEVWDVGMNLFLQRILRSPIKDHLISAVLNEIRVEREGYVIHRSDMKGCVDVLLALSESDDQPSVYKRDLEPAVFKESEAYYKAESEQLLKTCDASEYLARVETRLVAEEARAVHYLSTHTAGPLQKILQDNLLSPHLNVILSMPNSGLDVMIDTDKIDDIGRVYRLFTLVPEGLPTLRRALKESADRRGRAVNTAEIQDAQEDEDDAPEPTKGKGKGKAPAQTAGSQTLKLALQWVEDVLTLKDKFDNILKNALQGDRELESGLNEAFDSFINANEKSPEYISLFIDDHLKKGLKGKSDAEVEIVLDKTITVFRYVTEKDVFERYYKSHLAKRLLTGRSVSDDAERGMLAKLKIECGYQFTQKLEGMFHDMKLSDETMRDYSSYLQNMGPQPLDLSVTIMTSTFWPMSHTAAPCTLPTQLVNVTKTFERFYLGRHTGRRLTWQPALGNADVRVKFKAKKHDLNVSTYALVILLLFENLGDDEFLTYEEIKNATAIQESELQRNLQSLACAKWKILKKHPPGRDVNPSDSFSFNADFTSPLQKIKISTVAAKVESVEERKETRDRVDEERKHQTDACIVRIMKDRKHMTHNDLINEVTRQLASRFQPNPLQIKKRIESLIEREYLERCDDRKSYNYMA